MNIVIDLEGNEEQEVFAILDKQRHYRKLYYLVLFVGEPPSEAIWMHKSELANCKEKISEYDTKSRKTSFQKGTSATNHTTPE